MRSYSRLSSFYNPVKSWAGSWPPGNVAVKLQCQYTGKALFQVLFNVLLLTTVSQSNCEDSRKEASVLSRHVDLQFGAFKVHVSLTVLHVGNLEQHLQQEDIGWVTEVYPRWQGVSWLMECHPSQMFYSFTSPKLLADLPGRQGCGE